MRTLKVVEQIDEPEIAEAESWNGRLQMALLAPNGVQKLRELILELAMRGKLVPPSSKDEPAKELLKRMKVERDGLVKAGKIKEKNLPEIDEIEKPFALPDKWAWALFPDIANYRVGKTPPTKNSKLWSDNEIPWVSISDMPHYGEVNKTERFVSLASKNEIFKYDLVPAGTILMSFKLTVGKVSILRIDAYHNEAIISVFPYSGIDKDFLFRFLPLIAKTGRSKSAIKGNTLNSESI